MPFRSFFVFFLPKAVIVNVEKYRKVNSTETQIKMPSIDFFRTLEFG